MPYARKRKTSSRRRSVSRSRYSRRAASRRASPVRRRRSASGARKRSSGRGQTVRIVIRHEQNPLQAGPVGVAPAAPQAIRRAKF